MTTKVETKSGSMIVTKAADVGIDVAQIEALMKARGIDTEKIPPAVAAARFCRLVISTEDVDGIGDVVKSSGWDFSTWLENPALFADHAQKLSGTVARGLQAFIDTSTKSAIVDAFFVPPEFDKDGLADFVMGLYQSGLAKGVSIGAQPTKYHWAQKVDVDAYGPDVRRVWDESKLFEVSFVGIPMNSHALVAHVAKSLSDGTMDGALVSRVADSDAGEWSIAAKAALYAVKSQERRDHPMTVINAPVGISAEMKAAFDSMQEQIAAQGRTLRRMAETKSDDVAHISKSKLERVLGILAEAVEELVDVLPDEELPANPPPTEEDAATVLIEESTKSAPQYQRLVDLANKTQTTKEA